MESDEDVGGDCTGTLIERDLVLTAGHCFCEQTINQITLQTATGERYSGFPDSISVHVDDCDGEEEDDASQDLALFRLTAPVPEEVVNAPLLIPYLWDDLPSRAKSNSGVSIAGYGGDEGGGSERPLLKAAFNDGTEFHFQTGNWFVPWGSGSYWISFVSDVDVTGVLPVGGDSGAPLIVRLNFDGKRYIIAVHKGDNSRGWSESRELLSPTWNNGDGNGDWIGGHLSDADQDGVPDGADNCSGDSSPRCAESERRIAAWSAETGVVTIASGSWYPARFGMGRDRYAWIVASGPRVMSGSYESAQLCHCRRESGVDACEVEEGPVLPLTGSIGSIVAEGRWVALTGCSEEDGCNLHVLDVEDSALYRIELYDSSHGVQVLGLTEHELFAADFSAEVRGTASFDGLIRYDLERIAEYATPL